MACVASRDRAARKLAEALASASNRQLGRALRAKARAGLHARSGAKIVHARLNVLAWHGRLSTREMFAEAGSTAGEIDGEDISTRAAARGQ